MFEARLQALARANRQLAKTNSSGVNLNDIVRVELEPFVGRTTVKGVGVMLGPQYGLNVSLALHELATNAAKYGALSNASRKVEVSWALAGNGKGNRLKFKWQERGGPPVIAPTRYGFGTSLLNATFSDVRLDYAVEGLSCEFDVPLGRMEPGATDALSPECPTTDTGWKRDSTNRRNPSRLQLANTGAARIGDRSVVKAEPVAHAALGEATKLGNALHRQDRNSIISFRKKVRDSLDELQAELDAWIKEYNEERHHQVH